MFNDPLQAKLREMEERDPSTTQYEPSFGEKAHFAKRWFLGSAESADKADARNPTGEREFQRFMNSSNRSYKAANYDYQALARTIEFFAENDNEDGLRRVVDFVKAEIPDLETHLSYLLLGEGKITGLHFGQARDQLIKTLYSGLEKAGYLGEGCGDCASRNKVCDHCATFDGFHDVKDLKKQLDNRKMCRERVRDIPYPRCVVAEPEAFL